MSHKVGDPWLDEVEEIKEEVRNHFENLFQEEYFNRPTLDGINFKRMTSNESDFLSFPFSLEEVEEVVWSCEGNKSPEFWRL